MINMGEELETSNIKLSLLQKTDKKFISDYLAKDELISTNSSCDMLSKLEKRFKLYKLHVPCEKLDKNEKSMKILNKEVFPYSQLNKFENFFQKAFFLNGFKCGVYSDIFIKQTNDYDYFLGILDELDKYDKYLFLHQFLNLYPTRQTNFIIKDEKLLRIFANGMARSYIENQIFFLKYPIAIFSHDELSLFIFFKNKNDISKYQNIANECGLGIGEYHG